MDFLVMAIVISCFNLLTCFFIMNHRRRRFVERPGFHTHGPDFEGEHDHSGRAITHIHEQMRYGELVTYPLDDFSELD